MYVEHHRGPVEHPSASARLPLDSLGFCLLLPSVFAPLCSMSVCVCLHKYVYISILYLNSSREDVIISGNLYSQKKTCTLVELLCQDVS